MRTLLAMLLLPAAAIFAQPPSEPAEWREWFNRGLEAYRHSAYSEAAESLAKAVELNPASREARLYLGAAYLAQNIGGRGDPKSLANEQLAWLVDHEPRNADAFSWMDQVAEWSRKAIAADPNETAPHYTLGLIAWLRCGPSREMLQGKQSSSPDDAEQARLNSRCDAILDEGIANFERVLAIDPRFETAHMLRGMLQFYRPREAPRPVPPAVRVEPANQIRVSAEAQEAKLIHKVEPVYPPLAQHERIQGTVKFGMVVGWDGRVENLQLRSGHPLLVEAARLAVSQYIYKPTLLNGNPVKVASELEVKFTLP